MGYLLLPENDSLTAVKKFFFDRLKAPFRQGGLEMRIATPPYGGSQ